MDFIDMIHTLRAGPRDILVSFDIISLFTMVPIEEALHLLSRHFDKAILRLFHHVLTSSFFSFNGQFHEQTDGVAMGSPLSPVIANYSMEYFEEMALEAVTHKPLC
jgi:retron-type reverse transcriptase